MEEAASIIIALISLAIVCNGGIIKVLLNICSRLTSLEVKVINVSDDIESLRDLPGEVKVLSNKIETLGEDLKEVTKVRHFPRGHRGT